MSLEVIKVVLLAGHGYRTLSATLCRFDDFEDILSFRFIFLIRIVNHVGVQLCKLVHLNEPTLISEPLFSQVSPALVSHVLRAGSLGFLFLPVFPNLLPSLLS